MISNWFPTREPPTSLRPVSSLWSEPILLFDFSFHYKNNKRRKIPCLVFFPAISFSFFLSFFFGTFFYFVSLTSLLFCFPPTNCRFYRFFFSLAHASLLGFTGFLWSSFSLIVSVSLFIEKKNFDQIFAHGSTWIFFDFMKHFYSNWNFSSVVNTSMARTKNQMENGKKNNGTVNLVWLKL